MYDELRLRQLAVPKASRAEKVMSEEEIEKKREKEAELAARKNRHKKFDFAGFINRDGDS